MTGLDLSGLNPAQRRAVTAPPGFHLVVAGAGTGKTRTLVHRVAWLIDQGADPGGIVLLTFTRRAAAEMLGRCSQLVGPTAQRVRGGTFHAFCSRSLRQLARDGFAAAIGRSPDFTVLDAEDATDLVGLVREERLLTASIPLATRRRFPNKATLQRIFSRQANLGGDLADSIEAVNPRFLDLHDEIAEIARACAARRAERDLVDYDDLLLLTRDLLKKEARARQQLAQGCAHVLVDEYQDTNKVQGHIAALLATAHGDLMVVGDEAQSIYRFRGARVENILEFPTVFPDARVTVLEENYRSRQPVLDLANQLLSTFRRGHDKRLHSQQQGGPRPVIVEVAASPQEAQAVVERVLALREQGLPLREQAVLFRAGHHSALLEGALARADLPFRKFGGLRFTEAAHVKDVLAVLRLLANPRDELAWMRVLQWIEGVGPRTAARLAAGVLAADPPRLAAEAAPGKAWSADLDLLAALLEGAATAPLAQQVQAAVAYVRDGLEDRYEDAWRRDRDLEAVPLLASAHDSLESFLAEAALEPPDSAEASPEEDEDEWLTLSTVHSAKGLEWTAVFVLQLADGQFPSARSMGDPLDLDEERRLLYVAITRARRDLFLMRPRLTGGFGAYGSGAPAFGPGCTLLDEIPELASLVTRQAPSPPPTTGPATDPQAEERLARVLAWLDD